jgi:hypothetical protein
VIKFGSIRNNIGNAYSSGTGVFTCPHRARYSFTVTIMVLSGHRGFVQLMYNGNKVGEMYLDSERTGYQSASNTFKVDCTRRGRVWVEASGYVPQSTLHSSPEGLFTSFSGAKIEEL